MFLTTYSLSLLFTDVDINETNFPRILQLFKDLEQKEISFLALDNDALAIKIFLDPVFQDKLQQPRR